MSINILMKFLWIGSVFWSPERNRIECCCTEDLLFQRIDANRDGVISAEEAVTQLLSPKTRWYTMIYIIYNIYYICIYIHTNSYVYSIYLSQITPRPFLWELCFFKWTCQALYRTPTLSNPFLPELSSLTAHSAAISIWRTLFFVASVADEEIEMRADDILGH